MWWTTHLEGGPRRVNHAACVVDTCIYSFGGYRTGDSYRSKFTPIDVYVFNTHTLQWKKIPTPDPSGPDFEHVPFMRYGHTVVAFQGRIYLFGGRNDLAPCNDLFCFDVSTWRWSRPKVTGPLPERRDGHTACVIHGFMYVFGGFEEAYDRMDNSVYTLNLRTMEWKHQSCEGPTPYARDFHTATVFGDRMVIFGGRTMTSTSEYYNNKLCYLDTANHVWREINTQSCEAPSGRRSHTALNIHGDLYIFGGFHATNNDHMNDMWKFDFRSSIWTKVYQCGLVPKVRRRHAMCLVDDKVYVFGGTSPYNGPRLFFTQMELALIPMDGRTFSLVELDDMHILELSVSLRTLCLMATIENNIPVTDVPKPLMVDREAMTRNLEISPPLKTRDDDCEDQWEVDDDLDDDQFVFY